MNYGMPPYGGQMEPPNMDDLQDFIARAESRWSQGPWRRASEMIIEALQTVYDPEIPVNIYDLGLIYETAISGGW